MFDLIPFGKRREDAFGQLVKSFNDVFSDDWFTSFKGSLTSFKTDIRETGQSYLVEAELPGFQKEDIEISYAEPYLTIKAVRKEDNNVDNRDEQVVRRERRYGEYTRSFYVPDIDADGINASLKDGVLNMEIPKQPNQRTKRIQIREDI
ncbi:HSP20 family protein [Paenibacillus rhizosphaerae]|uniref:HSP20 family protein n=1 Tax=Paenibacillus rhizosphaerae TaxID=297318 RepID=A0A839TSS2_9BACL|nr:Hsp20/alpha crystallin family protein [Paenibacillus rhizosphaerae]MBB3129876.1 HSP20 family protein [Paenibacillus rhizosphaerae]